MATETPDMPPQAIFSHTLAIDAFARQSSSKINIVPQSEEIAAICTHLGLKGLRKVTLRGDLKPLDRTDWRLTARLGATIIQECVVTLRPVTTRIEDSVERVWMTRVPELSDSGSEEEIPEDTNSELLGKDIDLGQVLIEALGLALPPYPRAQDATLEQATFAAPGTTPMEDEETRPFAGLAALRDKMSDTTDDGDQNT